MKTLQSPCRIAVVQAAPVLFDKDACLAKALRLIDEAAAHGAELIVFPELFIPGYPYGMTFGFTVGSRTERAAGTGSATTTRPFSSPARKRTPSPRRRSGTASISPWASPSGTL